MSMPQISAALSQVDDTQSQVEGEICDNCGNVYRIERLKEGKDYNDFGQRYCPFCGQMTNEW